LFDNQMPETLILGQSQVRVGRKDRHRRSARPSHQVRITFQVADLERG
jgi:hypothetical protein